MRVLKLNENKSISCNGVPLLTTEWNDGNATAQSSNTASN